MFCGGGCGDDGSESNWQILSPDGRLEVSVDLGERDLVYGLRRDGQAVLEDSPLGISLDTGALVRSLRFVRAERRQVEDTYRTVAGKRRERVVEGRELVLHLTTAHDDQLELVVRTYDDGMAFRYRLPEVVEAEVRSEATGFKIPLGGTAFLLPYDLEGLLFLGSYEMAPEWVEVGASTNSTGWAYPALFEVPTADTWLLITEADLDEGYCGTRLAPDSEGGLYQIRFPDEREGNSIGSVEPQVSDGLQTPWRVVLAGDPSTLVESTLVEDLSRPSQVEDTSWILPGRVAWSWLTQDTGDAALQREYLDFAGELGWEYILIDAQWDQWPDADTVVPALVAEAEAKGVGILLWYNSGGEHTLNTSTPRDCMQDPQVRQAEMERLATWGVAGIKVDFFESDKQDRIQQYLGILEDAAANRLLVNFHGATVSRGWQRTYPNLMTQEAVRGAEYFRMPAIAGRPSADTHLYNVFARNVVGSMDYTPVVFEHAFLEGDLPYAHSLAEAVLFESGLQHLADRADLQPDQGYRAVFAAFPFVRDLLAAVPVAWDDTRLLDGHPQSHAILARRHGADWWIAGIAGSDDTLDRTLSLDFLGAGNHRLELVTAGNDPQELTLTELTVDATSTLDIRLDPRGGFLARLSPE
jgi:hypothetical protein